VDDLRRGRDSNPRRLSVSTIRDNFLGLPRQFSGYTGARFAVLPIPYDATTSYGVGTRDGPRAVITASQQVEWYDPALGRESHRAGIATLDALEPDVRGPAEMHDRIHAAARKVVRDGKFLIGLGGEHSVTSALVRAVRSRHKRVSVLQIDAHADLRDAYQGSPYSHASVMRRIHEMDVPAVGVGIRSHSAEEARFIRRTRLPILTPSDCRADGWIDRVVEHLTDDVYITVDIDGFDPAFAPGTGTPEPGGLDWRQVTELLAAVAQRRCVVAADLVEVRPVPAGNVTEFLAARLLYRLIGLVSG
jgi:agmatinase